MGARIRMAVVAAVAALGLAVAIPAIAGSNHAGTRTNQSGSTVLGGGSASGGGTGGSTGVGVATPVRVSGARPVQVAPGMLMPDRSIPCPVEGLGGCQLRPQPSPVLSEHTV